MLCKLLHLTIISYNADVVSSETNPELLRTTLREAFEVNVVGVANTISAFLPLIKKSKIKKVITISSGMADLDLVNRFSVAISAPYTISKAAVNMLVAKYHGAYKAQGILFVAISPGFVDTSEGKTSMCHTSYPLPLSDS
jgi:NAD(P)-dependent dehydrogenase (short-subunit alcohol dehydrogenase family)